MTREKINELLFSKNTKDDEKNAARYLEQYKLYIHILDKTSTRRQKSNEFFLGINAAIIGILGYIETKSTFHSPVLFIFIPLVGIGICYSWYKIISSYKQLNRTKFRVIHAIEQHLPLALFETEWEMLGRGKNRTIYNPLSQIERNIPIMFVLIYIAVIFTKLPWQNALDFLK